MKSHAEVFFHESGSICSTIDTAKIELLADELAALRERKGRLFFIGVGGSAGNCSHAVNDFRKLCGIETYSVDKQAYVGTPCPAGTTYENPAGKAHENFNTK